jgi:hypothetical protein
LNQEKSLLKSYNVHPELQKYVTTFKEKMAMAGVSKSTKNLQAHFFQQLMIKSTARECFVEIQTIRILETEWIRLDEAGKEELMYHELGHCILGRDHTEHSR